MKIRLLEKRDIDACAAIVGTNYSGRYGMKSKAEIASMFSNSAVNPVYWVAEDKRGILGFAGYIQSWMDYGVYQLTWVNVRPEFQRQGIGRRLVARLISQIRRKYAADLIQLTSTSENVTFYRAKFGFSIILKLNDTPEYLMGLKLRS